MRSCTPKRALSLLLALAMLFSLLVPAGASPEEDAPAGAASTHWAAKELEAWGAKGWLNGNENGDYMPDAQVSRAQYMAFVNRMMGYTKTSSAVSDYADVPSDAWYYQDVAAALEAGYMQGADGKMRPDAAITRQEAVVILARLAGFAQEPLDEGYLALVPDADAVPDWAKSAVSVAVREGFLAGIDGKLEGGRSISRAETVVLLDRFDTNTRVFGFAGLYGGSAEAPMEAGAVLIAAPGVQLKHARVKGGVEIGAAVGEGKSILEDVVIGGDLLVKGGGETAVYLTGVTVANTLGVWKPGVRVVVTGETGIKTMQLHTGAQIDVSGGKGSFRVEIAEAPEGETVTLTGSFDSVTNAAPGLKLTIDGHVDTLTLDAGADITGGGNVGKAVVSKDAGADTDFDKAPKQITGAGRGEVTVQGRKPGTSSSSSGGGSNPPQTGAITMGDLSDLVLVKGKNGTVTATATASNSQAVTIAAVSASPDVAAVSVADQVITVAGVTAGTAIVTVTASAASCDDVVKTFAVTVTEPGADPDPTGTITIDDLPAMTLAAGATACVTVTAKADNGETPVIRAASGAPAVAVVSVTGKNIAVTGVAAGTATITVTVTAPNCTPATKTFTVAVPQTGIDVLAEFVLFDGTAVPDIYVDAEDHPQTVRAVNDLRDDVERVTGKVPTVRNTTEGLGDKAIIVGSVDKSPVIRSMMEAGKLDEAKTLTGKWESYLIKLVKDPVDGVKEAIVIVGSDKRGGVYGVYDLSEQIGVSPWYYWGDILPERQDRIVIDTPVKIQGEPSVKYRGIFLNDEQNLAYWAAVTEEKAPGTDWENGNINPDTYAKVYELLLRLKANYLWTAMHSEPRLGPDANKENTMGAIDHFNKYPENRVLADQYGIIVGTSHCEPMMRNGTAEWGEFLQEQGFLSGMDLKSVIGNNKVDNWMYNYNENHKDQPAIPRYDYSEDKMFTLNQTQERISQKQFIDRYWNESVEKYKDYEVSYTLGMRGVHDAGFRTANASTTEEKLAVLQAVVDSQVKMMEENKVSEEAFPIFIPYKEVLGLYQAGLELPEETIIVWAEDNQGHIRQFPTAEELDKYAGSGVYYHLNYEGAGSYSWLNSVSPSLMLSEMRKAYESGAQELWVVNAGDIKPSEISIDLFLEMAWDIDRWDETNLEGTESEPSYYELLAEKWFPDVDSQEVTALIEGYFHQTAILKPDHTTGGTGGRRMGFSLVNYGDELMQRVAQLQDLAERAQGIYDTLHQTDPTQADAFYQHVAYPIVATYYNNLKYYHAQKNALYLEQGRPAAANLHAALVDWAHQQEDLATDYYNAGISGGKWDGIMQPHNSHNLRPDRSPKPGAGTAKGIAYMSKLGVVAEGERVITENSVLNFSAYLQDTHFIDLFNMGSKGFDYTAAADKDWVKVSEESGTVYDDLRLFVDIDWAKLPKGDQTATLTVTGAGERKEILIRVSDPAVPRAEIDGYAEANGYVAMEAEHYTENQKDGAIGFFTFEGLGRSGDAVSAGPMGSAPYLNRLDAAPYLTYQVYFQTAGTFPTTVYRIPTLEENSGQRFALGVDDDTPIVISGQNVAEKGNWESNVVNGIEKLRTELTIPDAGYHTIKLYMIDAGVAIDRIVVNTGGEADSNQGPPESYHSKYNPDPTTTLQLLTMHREYLETYITATVEPLILALTAEVEAGTCPREALDAVQATLDQVKTALEGTLKGDAVHRNYAKLASAVASVDALKNVDTLLAAALKTGETILKNGGGGIPIYRQEVVDAFQTTYAAIAEIVNGSELTIDQKLACYERLMVEINTVEAARNITVTADSCETTNITSHAVDGDPKTRWAAGSGGYPRWIQVDLGDIYSLDQLAINWYVSGNRAYKYKVSVSTDGVTFTQVLDRTDNTVHTRTEDTLGGTVGRYVKIDVTGSTNNQGSASIFEITITGAKPTDASAEDLKKLREEIEKAEQEEDVGYTIDSFDNLKTLAAKGKDLLDNEKASKEMVVQATEALKGAYDALTAKKIVFHDTFDGLDDITKLDESWKLTQEGGTVTLEADGTGNQYLKLEQKRDGDKVKVAADKVFEAIEGKVYIEAKISSDTPQYFFGAPYVYNHKDSATGGTNIMTAIAMRETTQEIRSTYKGNNSGEMTKLGNFVKGEWYTVTLVIDTATSSLQVYLDGVRKDDGSWKLRNAKDTVGKLSFYADDKDSTRAETTGYIDDVCVYTGETIVTPPVEDPAEQIEAACTALQAAVDAANALDAGQYTIDSHSGLLTAVSAGEAELEKQEHTLADLETCKASIEAATAALVEREYIVEEYFDDLDQETYRSELAATGWTFEETNGAVTLEALDGGQCLKIMQSSKDAPVAGARWTHETGLSGKVYVEVKVRSDAGATPFCAPFLYGADTANGDNTLCGTQLRENTQIASSFLNHASTTKPVGTFAEKEWNTICIIIDTESEDHKMQVYVNGERKDDGTFVLRNNLDVLKMIRFYSDDKDSKRPNAVGYIDDVRVYVEKQP